MLFRSYLGYDKASEIIEKSDHNPDKVKEIVLEENLMDKDKLDEILNYHHTITYL